MSDFTFKQIDKNEYETFMKGKSLYLKVLLDFIILARFLSLRLAMQISQMAKRLRLTMSLSKIKELAITRSLLKVVKQEIALIKTRA